MIITPLLTEHLKRTLLLSLFSFVVAMLLTPIYTHYAFKYKLWRRPRTHSVTGEELTVISKLRIKRTVPMMAGLVMVVAIAIVTLTSNLSRQQTWLPLAALAGGGVIGLIDDFINVKGKTAERGLRAPIKFALITIVALIGAWFFYYRLGLTHVHIPFVTKDLMIGWLIIPLFILVVVSTANAVNISDGMDGLAGGLLVFAYTAFAIIAALQNSFGIAAFCLTVVGALLAYVWFNIPPARFFMGDVGSFALGTALGVVAMLTNSVFLLPVICFVFVAEAGSSLIQILSKKIFHRRVFISAPIHHHFEATGWPKTKVTMRFWVIGQVCAVAGIALALFGGYI